MGAGPTIEWITETRMATIRKWLQGQGVTHIWFPKVDRDDYGMEGFVGVPEGVFKYDDPVIQKWLDVEFDSGFGEAHVPFYTAWSPTHVHYVHEYDGSTSSCSVKRNPPTLEAL